MKSATKYGYGLAAVIIVVIILVSLSALLPLSSEDSRSGLAEEDNADRTVTLIMRQKESDFWKTVRMGAEAAAKEFGVKLHVAAPNDEDDVDAQIKLVRQSSCREDECLSHSGSRRSADRSGD